MVPGAAGYPSQAAVFDLYRRLARVYETAYVAMDCGTLRLLLSLLPISSLQCEPDTWEHPEPVVPYIRMVRYSIPGHGPSSHWEISRQ